MRCVHGRTRTEPPAVAGGAAASVAAAFFRLRQAWMHPELAIRRSPAHRLPAPVLSLVAVPALALINIELLLVQQGITLHDDRLACEFFHLLQPARAVCL